MRVHSVQVEKSISRPVLLTFTEFSITLLSTGISRLTLLLADVSMLGPLAGLVFRQMVDYPCWLALALPRTMGLLLIALLMLLSVIMV